MQISAIVANSIHNHTVEVQTNGLAKTIVISPKPDGFGSAVNGGELLMLALATCFCNNIYREAKKKQIPVTGVRVTCHGEFGADGEAGRNFFYEVQVDSTAESSDIEALIRHTDTMAEIQNTLRKGVSIVLKLND